MISESVVGRRKEIEGVSESAASLVHGRLPQENLTALSTKLHPAQD